MTSLQPLVAMAQQQGGTIQRQTLKYKRADQVHQEDIDIYQVDYIYINIQSV